MTRNRAAIGAWVWDCDFWAAIERIVGFFGAAGHGVGEALVTDFEDFVDLAEVEATKADVLAAGLMPERKLDA